MLNFSAGEWVQCWGVRAKVYLKYTNPLYTHTHTQKEDNEDTTAAVHVLFALKARLEVRHTNHWLAAPCNSMDLVNDGHVDTGTFTLRANPK